MRVLAVILACAAATNPMSKVIDLLHSLEAKVTKAGEEENRAFEEMGDWCKEFSMEKHHEIENGEKDESNSKATIEKAASIILSSAARIEELSSEISTAESELAAATSLRKDEKATYQKTDDEFASSIDTLNRAHSILKRSLSNPEASLLQGPAASIIDAFTAIVNAESAFSATDKAQLTTLVQGVDQPSAKAYESKSGSILNLIRDLREKAEDERDDAQKAEMTAQHNFEMKAQALNNLITEANADLADAKKTKAAGEEEKAAAEGDLASTQKDLAEDRKALGDAQQECMQTAAEHEESLASRKAELEALQKAEAIILEKTGAAGSRTYASFVQLSVQRRSLKVVAALQQLATQENDQILAQVATSARAFARSGTSDVFGKVKGLIESMIAKLDKEANEDAEKNAFCVSETEKAEKSRDSKQATVDKLSAKIDKSTARSAQLKEEVATLQQELAALSKLQGHMDKARADESAAYKAYSADMTNGIEGVRMALQVLREYYAQDAALVQQPEVGTHAASSDAAGGIISMLEVAEADFTRGLAEATAAEDEASATYEKTTQENKIAKTTKEQDVKYKGAEAARLDKEIGELSSDRSSVNEELDSVMKYLEQLRAKCVQKPETYEERKTRREREINGLKEALTILENEAAPSFLQRRA
jgi:hypothetical protein